MDTDTLQQLIAELQRSLGDSTVFGERVAAKIVNAQILQIAGALLILIPLAIWLSYGISKRFRFNDVVDYVMGGAFLLLPVGVGVVMVVVGAQDLANPELAVYRDIVTNLTRAVTGS